MLPAPTIDVDQDDKAKFRHSLRVRIGRKLCAHYQAVVREGVPQRLADMLDRLDGAPVPEAYLHSRKR
jgi:hypothetical protein